MSARVRPKKKLRLNLIEGSFDFVTDNNFSYESIPTPKNFEIPSNQQMIVREEFTIEPGAELRLEGSLFVED